MKTISALVSCLLLVDVSLSGCSDSGGPGGSGGSGGSTGSTEASTSTGSTASSTSSASTGTGPGCSTAGDCPATSGECVLATCTAGVCGTMNAADGTPLANQTPGDCKQKVCDGSGGTKVVDDDNDALPDTNDCSTPSCLAGMNLEIPEPSGTACASSGGKVCGSGAKAGFCVACVVDADCSNGDVCDLANDAFTCVPPSCTDDSQNGQETGKDCGGPECSPCANGLGCLVTSDCQSGSCQGLVCAACGADADCDASAYCDTAAGTCVEDQGDGSTCSGDDQCVSGHCTDGVCCDTACSGTCEACSATLTGGTDGICSAIPATTDPDAECPGSFTCDGAGACESCSDGVQNGAETGVDCGGTCSLCGSSPTNAALSCADVLAKGPTAPSGTYYIQPAGAVDAYQVYCDMTNDGGGWTLLLAATASGTFWGNNSSNWAVAGTTGTIPAALDATAGEYKSAAYGDLVTNTIRLCYQDATHCHDFAHGMNQSLLSFFVNGTSYVEYSSDVNLYADTGSDTARTTYLSELGFTGETGQVCHWLGINHKDPIGTSFAAFSAIGLMGDFNSGCASSGSLNGGGTNTWLDDAAFGVGLQNCYDTNGCNPGGSDNHDGSSRGVNGVDNSGDIGPWFVLGK